MNPQAQTTSIGLSRSLSPRFARSTSMVGALAILAVNGLGCGTELGGPADDEAATASSASALSDNPWPTSWTSSNPATSTVKDDSGFTVIHYQGATGKGTGGVATASYAFATKAPADADLFFKWDYFGNHGSVKADVRLRAYANGPNGRREIFLVGTPQGLQPVSGAFGFSNKYDTALRVYAGEQYGFVVEGDDLDTTPVFQGDLNVQYRAEKFVKSVQFGGQLWPASPGQFSNIEQIAPPGEFITEVRVYWNQDVIRGVSWAYSDKSCVHAGPCMAGTTGSWFLGLFLAWPFSNNITFNSSERLGSCIIRNSGFGYSSLRELVLTKHPVMDATPQATTTVTFGPDGFDNQRTTDTNGDSLVGFYGVYNNDGFFASIGLITRKPQ